jgi:pimeloyl-ACP methyl ester carboxylesterase
VVLVHGAWADGSSWSEVIEKLLKDGYYVTAVQISMNSLTDDIAHVRGVLAAQNGPTILCGHSFGGAVITGLGKDAPNVVGLVYVAAFAPAQGETMKALAGGSPQPAGASAIRPDAQGYLWLDREGVVKYFAPDIDSGKARVLGAVQKPIAASEVFDEHPFDEPTWKFVPSWYIVAEKDQMIPPDAERFMAKRANATVTSISASHVVMISHAKETAELIEKAAKATSKPS